MQNQKSVKCLCQIFMPSCFTHNQAREKQASLNSLLASLQPKQTTIWDLNV